MSFFDDASLVFLPSGQAGKDGKAYSMKPTNGDGDFTFSRGSNLTATRVDSNGLIEKGRENLLTQSNNFSDSDWTKFGTITLTSGQSGYDGSNDAWLYESETSVHSLLQYVSGSSVYSFSVYAKAGTADGIRLRVDAATDSNIYVDLTDGSIITDDSDIAYKIESVGNGWYRVSITSNVSTLSNVRFNVTDNVGAQTTGNIYIQDAQLEQGLVATEYIESGASTGLAGILEDSPRFDYSGGASCPSLLLEPSRTNEIGQSEYFDSWTKISEPTITNNYGTSPEGVQNSTRFETTSGRLLYDVSTINADETFSIYMRGSGTLRMNIGSDNFYPSVTSDWVRYEFKTTQVGSVGNVQIRGNGSAVDVQLYGAQYERNTYATSYIPNHSGGSVTREADVCEGAGTSSTFNDAEGVLYAEIAALADDGTNKYISINNGGTDDYLFLRYRSDNRFQVRYRSNNTDSLNETFDLSNNLDFNKIAVSYKRNEFKIFVNGSQIGSTDTSGTIFNVSVDNLDFESFNGGSNFYGKVKQVIVFNTALSDAELTALTS